MIRKRRIRNIHQREEARETGADKVESPRVEAFLAEIEEVSRRHHLSISHEDHQGGFIIEQRSKPRSRWLNDASIGETIKTL